MEKFALLNLLKALETLSPQKNTEKDTPAAQPEPVQSAQVAPPPPSDYEQERLNVMSNVLSRHEQIANRIKNNRP